MYKLCIFVPLESKESLKEALFGAGAGKIGNYDCCCFETMGTGQFRPLENSNPALGRHGEIHHVQEVKLEMVVGDENITEVLAALEKSHPYEEPAYDVFKQAEIAF